jgi:glucokinase
MAGMRRGNTVEVANWPDISRTVDFDQIPPDACPAKCSILLNDLEACCHGIVSSHEQGDLERYFEQLCGPSRRNVLSAGHTAVLAVGSGLGAAVIVRGLGRPIVLPTEMGWCLAAGVGPKHPRHGEVTGLLEFASKAYKGLSSPIYEDMASGHGLILDYEFLTGRREADAKDIVRRTIQGDASCHKAMTMNYRWFTKCAQQLAIGMGCDSILMALADQVANRWFIQKIKGKLQQQLNDGTRPDWTRRMGLFGQIQDCNFNLSGATYIANRVAHEPQP